jgi:hypothetical protein
MNMNIDMNENVNMYLYAIFMNVHTVHVQYIEVKIDIDSS